MKKLILIGNGFDLAHDYKTTYKDFSDACTSPALEMYKNMVEKYCKAELLDGIYWYDFECMISTITSQWFQEYMSSYTDGNEEEKEYLDDIAQINSAFAELEVQLREYLGKVTKDRQSNKLESISNEISDNARVVSFNYTNVASRYTKNIYYIHGSLNEESIVLGYPLREDPCLMPPEGTIYAKEQLREYLDFKRFLMSRGMDLSSIGAKQLLIEMRGQISSLHSNRGEYDIRDDLVELIKEYMQMNNNNAAQIDIGVALNDIEELVVIGHSLKSDEDIIHEWLQKMPELRTVKIFTYCGETAKDIEAKKGRVVI